MYCVFRLCQINYYHTIPYHNLQACVCYAQLTYCKGSKFKVYWLTLLCGCYYIYTTAGYYIITSIILAGLSSNLLFQYGTT